MKHDPEHEAALALIAASHSLLVAQRDAQPDCYDTIRAAAQSAVELRFELTICQSVKTAYIRASVLDGQGQELLLIRALDLQAPQAPLQ